MNKINFNKNIRQQIYRNAVVFRENTGESLLDPDIIIDKIISTGENEETKKIAAIYDVMVNCVAYTDIMTSLLLKEKMGVIEYLEKELLDLLGGIDTYDELISIYNCESIIYSSAIKDIIDFHNSISYQKILRFKCLSSEDIAQISKINPLLSQDIEEYNIDLNVEYLIKKIYSGIYNFKSEEDLLNDASAFIITLLKVNKMEGYKIIIQMIENDIKVTNFMEYMNKDTLVDEMTEAEKSRINRLKTYKNYGVDDFIDNISFEKVKILLCSSLLYFESKEDINKIDLDEENNVMIDKIKKYRLGK